MFILDNIERIPREGDRNAFFFHKMVNDHKRGNAMLRIKINGVWYAEENGLKWGLETQ